MTDETIPASATGLLISNHELLDAIATLTNARAEKDPLDALIEAHRQAYVAFEEICNFGDYVSEDDSSYPILEAENDRRSDAEEAALTAVCAFPAQSLSDAKSKAQFLLKHMCGCQLLDEQVEALLRSFVTVAEDEAISGSQRYG
jgi:hypothetical protein